MQRHHKIMLAVALLLTVAAWFVWNVLLVGSDLSSGN
jgi:hypothetical protein